MASLLALASALFAWDDGRRPLGIDYYHYWIAPRLMHSGADIYDTEARSGVREQLLSEAREAPGSRRARAARYWHNDNPWKTMIVPNGTPFFYTALSPLVRGDYDAGFLLFQLVSLAAALAGALTLARLFGHPPWLALLLTALVCSPLFEPFRSDQRVANVNRLLLGGVALHLWLRSRRGDATLVGAGAALGLLVMFKPTVAPAAVLLAIHALVRNSRRELLLEGLGVAAGSSFAFAVSSLAFGSPIVWLAWPPPQLRVISEQASIAMGNYGLVALARELGGMNPSPPLLSAFFLCALAVAAAGTALLRRRPGVIGQEECSSERGLVASTGLAVFLVASPLVWRHYVMLAVPAILWLLGPAASRRLIERALSLLALVLLCRLSLEPLLSAGAVTLATLVLFGLLLGNLAMLGASDADTTRAAG
jgi:hypothetical protein